MILLSSEGKGLVRITSWQDVLDRSGYVPQVDPANVQLDKIIGEYSLESRPQCGLKGCATPHVRGYLVACKDGTETNIGNICGKRIFKVDFDIIKAKFRRDLNENKYRESINTFRNQIVNLEGEIMYLKDGERQGHWCFRELQFHAERAYSDDVLAKFLERAKRGEGRLVQIERLSKRERDLGPKGENGPQFRERLIGNISGIAAIRDYKKLRRILTSDLGSELETFYGLDETLLDSTALKHWYKWTQNVKKRMQGVKAIIDDAHRFLLPSNIAFLQANKHLL